MSTVGLALAVVMDSLEEYVPAGEDVITHRRLLDIKARDGYVDAINVREAGIDTTALWPEIGREAQHMLLRLAPGWRSLAHLEVGDPEPPLVGPFLAAEGVTVVYGPGGVGKGMLALYFTRELVKAGHTVMIIDYEQHPGEWVRRSAAIGFTPDERYHVLYETPDAPLKEAAPSLAETIRLAGVDYVVVDSFVPASGDVGDSMGGADQANRFYDGFKMLGVRAGMVIAHVAGSSERFPARPFGSVFVHNLARETWAVAPKSTDPAYVEETAWSPTVMTVELRCQKRNDGVKPENQTVQFAFYPDGRIEVSKEQPRGPKLHDLIAAVLRRGTEPMTVGQIVAAIRDETGDSIKPDSAQKALTRNPETFSKTAGSPNRWTLS